MAIIFQIYFDQAIATPCPTPPTPCPSTPASPNFNARFSVFEESSLTSYIVCKADSSNTSVNPTSIFLLQVNPSTGTISSSIKTTKTTWYYCMDVVALSSKKAAILTMTAAGRFSIFIINNIQPLSPSTDIHGFYPRLKYRDLEHSTLHQYSPE